VGMTVNTFSWCNVINLENQLKCGPFPRDVVWPWNWNWNWDCLHKLRFDSSTQNRTPNEDEYTPFRVGRVVVVASSMKRRPVYDTHFLSCSLSDLIKSFTFLETFCLRAIRHVAHGSRTCFWVCVCVCICVWELEPRHFAISWVQ